MRTTSQRRVRQLHELLKHVSHSTKCTSGASWSRPPSSWTGACGARKCVGVGCGDVLPCACAIHEPSYTIQVLSLHALSGISVSIPSVTRAALCVPSTRARPQVFLLAEKAASENRFIAVLGEVHLPCWRFIVVRHRGSAHWDVFSFLFTRLAAAHSFSNLFFSSIVDWDLLYRHFDPLCGLSVLLCYQVLVWHHCRQVFSSCSA